MELGGGERRKVEEYLSRVFYRVENTSLEFTRCTKLWRLEPCMEGTGA